LLEKTPAMASWYITFTSSGSKKDTKKPFQVVLYLTIEMALRYSEYFGELFTEKSSDDLHISVLN
jgi:hypothetical protein